jgi:phospholipid/cholesterol/gamma-HCH transport system substrate-binding protein
MKRDTANYALVGAFVVAMAVALLVALFQLTGRGRSTDTYYAQLTNTGGIKEGSVVTFEGHEIGRVGSIEIQPPSDKTGGKRVYLVTLKVQRGWTIPDDSLAKKTSFGLLAPLVVDIKAGNRGEPLKPGKTIQAEDTPTMMEALTDVANKLAGITEHGIEPLLTRLGERVDRVGEKVESTLPGVLNDLKSTLAQTNNASRLLERALREENQQHLTRLLANTETTTENFAQISKELERTRANLDKLLDQSNDLIDANRQDIRASVQEIRQSLQRVNSILHHFENTGRNMAEFSREIRENPSSLIKSNPPPDRTGAQRR